MAEERGGNLGAMQENYCVDNGAMIAYTGLLEYINTGSTPFEDTYYT
jgi:N6-L-threonylcarbamoyladenine synthase